ncbi:Blue-light-activated histidine kinase [Poriferisphaera corsica]|uniref:histidine kinase n=1 Tax=Poriferisphaera corsica TaxID=2528020 RepID=A0A517YZB7_9BACT|nr:transporter substrate-binding domain-containing protein [Poriferisphaera corsica]QDU35590.1 Blue-light-activated histidine kinase [Poriferisphaera corsica]
MIRCIVLLLIICIGGCGEINYQKTVLTQEQADWLASIDYRVRVGLTPGWPPISYLDKDGHYRGLSAEYLDLISQRLGIQFDFVVQDSWQDVLQSAKNHEVDMTVNISRVDDRIAYLNFTEPYYKDHINVVGLKQQFDSDEFDLLKMNKMRIGVLRNSLTHKRASKLFPQWKYLFFDTLSESMVRLDNQELDVVLGCTIYLQNQVDLDVDKLVQLAVLPTSIDSRIAIRKDWDVLFELVQQTMSDIPEDSKHAINARWLGDSESFTLHDFDLRSGVISNIGLLCTVSVIIYITHLRKKYRISNVVHTEDSQGISNNYQNLIDGLDCNVCGIVISDFNKEILAYNRCFSKMTGYDDQDMRGLPWQIFGNAEDMFEVNEQVNNLINGDVPFVQHDKSYICKDGHLSEFFTTIWVKHTEQRSLDCFLSVIVDVSEHKHELRAQQSLLRELDHRVKNNLSEVLSLIDRTNEEKGIHNYKKSLADRVYTMARTHEVLASTQWRSMCVTQLIRLVLMPYVHENTDRININSDSINVPTRTCSPLSMVIHELATNAVKYGSLSRIEGRLNIECRIENEQWLLIEWKESCGPLIHEVPNTGFGTKLVRGIIEFELQGECHIEYFEDGLDCKFKVKLISDEHML